MKNTDLDKAIQNYNVNQNEENRNKLLEIIYTHHYKILYNYTSSYFTDSNIIEDLITETFLKILEKFDNMNTTLTEEKIQYWLYLTLKNTITEYNKIKLNSKIDTLNEMNKIIENKGIQVSNNIIAEAIENVLSPTERSIILASYYEGSTIPIISNDLQISPEIVRTLRFNAEKKLTKFIKTNNLKLDDVAL